MKARSSAVTEQSNQVSNYHDDPLRLVVTIKAMARAVFLSLHTSPWKISTGRQQIRVNEQSIVRCDAREELIGFSLLHIFVCLDCLHDVNAMDDALVHGYSVAILVLTNTVAIVRKFNAQIFTGQTLSDVRKCVLPLFGKWFKHHLLSAASPQAASLLRLFLSLVRSAVSFFHFSPDVVADSNPHATQGGNNSPISSRANDDEELWGSIDDAALDSIDLNVSDSSDRHAKGCTDDLSNLRHLMVEALFESRVS